MGSPGHKVQRPARINPLVDRRCFVQSFGLSRRGPSKYQAGFAARPWHRRPANRRAVNQKARNRRATSRKAMNQKATNRKVMNPRGVSQKAKNRMAEMPDQRPQRSTPGSFWG